MHASSSAGPPAAARRPAGCAREAGRHPSHLQPVGQVLGLGVSLCVSGLHRPSRLKRTKSDAERCTAAHALRYNVTASMSRHESKHAHSYGWPRFLASHRHTATSVTQQVIVRLPKCYCERFPSPLTHATASVHTTHLTQPCLPDRSVAGPIPSTHNTLQHTVSSRSVHPARTLCFPLLRLEGEYGRNSVYGQSHSQLNGMP